MTILLGSIFNYIFGLLGIIIITGITVRIMYNYLSKEKQENAVVMNRQSYDRTIYRKSQAPYIKKEYVITFQCKNKKRHFEVSEYSYNNYKTYQKGVLIYKGSRLIDFK